MNPASLWQLWGSLGRVTQLYCDLPTLRYNGSGKTTFASLILRLLDFQQGELLINGVDIRRYNPRDLHSHTTALFQQFARFSNSTLRENTGFGLIDSLESTQEIATALDRAGAGAIVAGCPDGIDTKLDFSAFDSPPSSGGLSPGFNGRRSLSGGEVSSHLW